MIDTHCHFSHPDFDPDREAVIDRAFSAGVTAVLEVGYSVETSRKAIELARRYPRASGPRWGSIPHEAGTRRPTTTSPPMAALIREPEVMAMGETGLDFYRDWAPRDRQLALFDRTVALAVERDLPLVIHDREAHEDVLRILAEAGGGKARGIFHCFSGDRDVANAPWPWVSTWASAGASPT